jgi:hypothetical protein
MEAQACGYRGWNPAMRDFVRRGEAANLRRPHGFALAGQCLSGFAAMSLEGNATPHIAFYPSWNRNIW